MATRILNGGLELAILESIEQDRKLTESEKLTKEKLDFLQKGEWVYLDDKANPISQVDVVSDFMKRLDKKESTLLND